MFKADNQDQSVLADMINTTITDQKIKELWNGIEAQNGEVISSASDADNRPKFVGLQAIIEANIATAIAQSKITAAVGVIHTKLPATPLRSDGTITENLIASEIMQDPARLATVLERSNIIRNFLAAGGRLIAAYPKSSLTEQIPGFEIFQSLLAQYGSNLVNFPLDEFLDEYTGATYLIEEGSGKIICFSIMATQANNPGGQMGIWFGSFEQEKVKARFDKIDEFLKKQNLDLMAELPKGKKPGNPTNTMALAASRDQTSIL
jgi:hypothetical protein